MSIQILTNVQAFLNRVTATGAECSAWHEASQFIASEIRRLKTKADAAMIHNAISAAEEAQKQLKAAEEEGPNV